MTRLKKKKPGYWLQLERNGIYHYVRSGEVMSICGRNEYTGKYFDVFHGTPSGLMVCGHCKNRAEASTAK